jgi:hypothetical protein
MENIRSLKEVRKQYKERALLASKVSSTTPRPSPPVSECEFHSSANSIMEEINNNSSNNKMMMMMMMMMIAVVQKINQNEIF